MIGAPLISGLTRYFKDLSVSGSALNLLTGWRQKVRLFYADTEKLDKSRAIELDATTSIVVSMDTDLLKTPAENQEVYTLGALKKPRRIDIQAHIDKTKLEQLNYLWKTITPVYVLTEKNLSGVITQIGYWTDSCKYGIINITETDTGYDNTVAVSISLEEIRLFTYAKEYEYILKSNKIVNSGKNKTTIGNAQEEQPYLGAGHKADVVLKNMVDNNKGGNK